MFYKNIQSKAGTKLTFKRIYDKFEYKKIKR